MTEPGNVVLSMSRISSAASAEVTQPIADSAIPPSLRDIDPQMIEALRRGDRDYVLKLGHLMESLINDEQRQWMELLPFTDTQHSLVHQCCGFYQLKSEVDPLTGIIHIESTSESCIPCPMLKLSKFIPTETDVHSSPLSTPQSRLLQTLLPPLAGAPSNLRGHVESNSDRMITLRNRKDHLNSKAVLGAGSFGLDETDVHHWQETSSKAPKTTTDSKRPMAEIQDDSGSQESEVPFRNQLKEFRAIYRLDESWPPDDLVLLLSDINEDSEDLASLAVRYLRDPFIGDPQLQLYRLLNIFKGATDDVKDLPLLHLYDLLCLDILSRIPTDTYKNNVKPILESQVLSIDSPRDKSLAATCVALSIPHDRAYESLRYLHPVMFIPSPRDITRENIKIYDDSFLPFLTDPDRSHAHTIMRNIAKDREALNKAQANPSSSTSDTVHASEYSAGYGSGNHQIDDSIVPSSQNADHGTNPSDAFGFSASATEAKESTAYGESGAQQTSQMVLAKTSAASFAATTARSKKWPKLSAVLATDTSLVRFKVSGNKPSQEIFASTFYMYRNVPANTAPTAYMHIFSKQFPWSIEIKSGKDITCSVIWNAIWASLQEPILDSEWGLLCASGEAGKKHIQEIMKANKKRLELNLYADKRILRCDYLGENVWFLGLEKDTDFQNVRMLPGLDHVRKPTPEDTWLVKMGK